VPAPNYCIAGLGNPGERYNGSRHNLGFRVADEIARERSTDIRRLEYQALTAGLTVGRSEVLLMKPQTYMNRSGESVAEALGTLALDAAGLVVVYDDLDLPVGRIRVRRGGGSGGHRGVASIIEATGESGFTRVRIGIGRPPVGVAVEDFVLQPFENAEMEAAEAAVSQAAQAVSVIVEDGVEPAMRIFNPAADPAPSTGG